MATFPRAQHFVECTQCNKNAEYFCNTCTYKLCTKCKKNHQISHTSKHHDVVIYRQKQTSVPSLDLCQKHADLPYTMCCQQCEVPVCQKCIKEGHKKHYFVDIDVIFESKQEEFESQVYKIRDQILPKYRDLLENVQGDITKCREEIAKVQSTMTLKARTLKSMIDTVLAENTDLLKWLEKSIMSDIREQEKIVSGHISELQNIVDEYDKLISENKHASFVQFQHDNQTRNLDDEIPKLNEINVPSFVDHQAKEEDIVRLFGEIIRGIKPATTRIITNDHQAKDKDIVRQLGERKKCPKPSPRTRKITNAVQNVKKSDITAIPNVAKITSFTVPDVEYAQHISPITADQVWVSDICGNLVLTNVKGEKLNNMSYPTGPWGCHSTSATGEFLTIIKNRNIVYKVTNDNEKLPCIDISPDIVCGIYASPLNGDMLVGMAGALIEPIIVRYKSTGQKVQKIQYDKTGELLYGNPRYLTENRKNGDVCVSDGTKDVVVVVDKDGNYRFSYNGHLPESGFLPRGITSDLQGQILVSDLSSKTVQMINQNGKFISFLLTTDHGIEKPSALNLDVGNNLWVGEEQKNTVSVYQYINN